MFKKYFSHEFKNTCQMPLTICGIIIAISILFCIGAIFELEFLLTFFWIKLQNTLYLLSFIKL